MSGWCDTLHITGQGRKLVNTEEAKKRGETRRRLEDLIEERRVNQETTDPWEANNERDH